MVDPPTAPSTAIAFVNEPRDSSVLGRTPSRAMATARRPDATAWRRRSPVAAAAAPPPGSINPNASTKSAMVEAVPITMQVPAVGQSAPSTSSIATASTAPARCRAQNRRQSVQAPSRSPCQLPVSIGPVTTSSAGRSAEMAAISCAGTVLSQPPSSTTASIGCALIISSVSIAARLR